MSLNPQQLKVLRHIAEGYSYSEIGRQIFLSAKRVEAIAQEIKEVLGANNMPHAVSIAYQKKILEIE